MKNLCFIPHLLICLLFVSAGNSSAIDSPDVAELLETSGVTLQSAVSPYVTFNTLNTLIRDGKIARPAAQVELRRVLAEVAQEYHRKRDSRQLPEAWIFPVAGYDSRAITGGKNKGYIAGGYDYFSGNRHGGHPSFDIFIHDRNQDGLDDRTQQPVQVLAMTGGIVVALEREWEQGSLLRGGKYLWVYDPHNELLVYYAHNSQLHVELGEVVKPGDVIATVGRSGYNAAKRRSPTHLHLTVLKVKEGSPLPVNVYQELAQMRNIPAGSTPVPPTPEK